MVTESSEHAAGEAIAQITEQLGACAQEADEFLTFHLERIETIHAHLANRWQTAREELEDVTGALVTARDTLKRQQDELDQARRHQSARRQPAGANDDPVMGAVLAQFEQLKSPGKKR